MDTTQPIVTAPEIGTVAGWLNKIRSRLDWLAPIADLLVRLWVANAFWRSGLVKIQSWDSTISLFTYEYQVPLLPPEIAAYLGTFAELVFPVLLALEPRRALRRRGLVRVQHRRGRLLPGAHGRRDRAA